MYPPRFIFPLPPNFTMTVVLSSAEARVTDSNNYHFESLAQDSVTKGNKWAKERLCA